MLFVISPAKKLDLSEETRFTDAYTEPEFQKESGMLVSIMKKKTPKKIGALMDISENLSQLNYERYQEFSPTFTLENSKQALLMFKGDVYQSFNLDSYQEGDFEFAQKHLRILSGLYGVLKPLDLIQAYRLEMGTRLKNRRGKNLYEFWKKTATKAVNQALEESGSSLLVNAASNEYFKVLDKKSLKADILDLSFKDMKNGTYKSLFLFVKQARGAIVDYAIKERIIDKEGLKGFTGMGYHYNEELSTESHYTFTREREA